MNGDTWKDIISSFTLNPLLRHGGNTFNTTQIMSQSIPKAKIIFVVCCVKHGKANQKFQHFSVFFLEIIQ